MHGLEQLYIRRPSLDRAKLGHGQHSPNDAWACRSTILMPPKLCCRALASLALGVMVFQRSAARAGLLLVCITTAALLRYGSAAQHNSAFCSKDKSKFGLSSACSSAQTDKNLNLKDECFTGHCNTGQYVEPAPASLLVAVLLLVLHNT